MTFESIQPNKKGIIRENESNITSEHKKPKEVAKCLVILAFSLSFMLSILIVLIFNFFWFFDFFNRLRELSKELKQKTYFYFIDQLDFFDFSEFFNKFE